ncbi:MAG: hypothetical protein NTW29_12810 [Bacteroidetes bacterium]|nr:hypothetical protein [Bacteroidota bacterium]
MKKLFIALSSLLVVGIHSATAKNGPEPGQKTLEAFKKEFISAEQVTWDKQDVYDKATFMLAGCRAVAFFNSNGELEGSVRDIFYNQLPLSVMTTLDKKFPDAAIFDVREITNAEGTSYRVTLEDKAKRKIVRVDAGGQIDDVEKG